MHEISAQTLKDLARPIPFLSLLAVASNWLFLAGIVFSNHFYFHPLLLSLSFLFIGRIQAAHLGLTHEATHLRIPPSQRINDAVGQYFCASPSFSRCMFIGQCILSIIAIPWGPKILTCRSREDTPW